MHQLYFVLLKIKRVYAINVIFLAIRIEDKDYLIHRIRGIYEESELVKMEVKVHCAYEVSFN